MKNKIRRTNNPIATKIEVFVNDGEVRAIMFRPRSLLYWKLDMLNGETVQVFRVNEEEFRKHPDVVNAFRKYNLGEPRYVYSDIRIREVWVDAKNDVCIMKTNREYEDITGKGLDLDNLKLRRIY